MNEENLKRLREIYPEGLIPGANDSTDDELERAAVNEERVRGEWCSCKRTDAERASRLAYYRSPETGSHGWACTDCLGIVQTG